MNLLKRSLTDILSGQRQTHVSGNQIICPDKQGKKQQKAVAYVGCSYDRLIFILIEGRARLTSILKRVGKQKSSDGLTILQRVWLKLLPTSETSIGRHWLPADFLLLQRDIRKKKGA